MKTVGIAGDRRTVSKPGTPARPNSNDTGTRKGTAGSSSGVMGVFVPGSRITYGSWVALENTNGKFLCLHRRGPKLHGKMGVDTTPSPFGGDPVSATVGVSVLLP